MDAKIPTNYIPNSLSRVDKDKQKTMINKSRKMYRKNKYYVRNKLKSFKSRKSKHIKKAMEMFNTNKIGATKELADKSGCSVKGLKLIIKKGEGAYYSSGSRPNQTPQSWGIARLASALTGGPASKIDKHILDKYCKY